MSTLFRKKIVAGSFIAASIFFLGYQVNALAANSPAFGEGKTTMLTSEPSCKPEIRTVVKRVYINQPVKVEGKLIIGEIENVSLPEMQLTLPARIDTGATTTSVDAQGLEHFERDGSPWVRFYISLPNQAKKTFEFPQTGTVRIKQKGTEKPIERPVIKLSVKVGDINHKIRVTLADRTNFEFPVLIGRNFLRDVAMVDVSQKFIATKHNKAKPE